MKKSISLILASLMLLSLVACGAHGTEVNTDDPVATAKAWIEAQVKDNTLFSFDYEGEEYAQHIKSWKKTVDKQENAWTVTYQKGDVTAWSEITIDEETASVEWTNYFKNEGSSDSPSISNIQALNSTVSVESPRFTTAVGSDNTPIDFQPIHVDLEKEFNYSMETIGGRSSHGAFPYFEIFNGNYGVFGGIGWTGDWKADFAYENGSVRMVAGMKETNISLYAGEQMRTPMIMLMFYAGDQTEGHNDFRQLILKNYTPKDENGETVKSIPTFIGINGNIGEQKMIDLLAQREEEGRPYDGMWIDATWYGEIVMNVGLEETGWVEQVGNWYFIKDAYPNGNMLRVSEWLLERNKEVLVWFEPERAMPGTKLVTEHPEWFLGDLNGKDRLLFDMSNDEACEYMTQWLSGILKENKITWYRQDFNMEPADKWSEKDTENRVGMTEIKHITNLYRFLDGLVESNPGLMIDNCASGGRRLDLEMMSRSFPLWRSDITTSQKHGSTPDNVRTLAYNLSWWLPLHGGGYPSYFSENTSLLYDMRSYFTGAQTRTKYEDEAVIKQVIEEYNEYKDMLVGDYYILACGIDESGIEATNSAYEYYLPEEGRGFIMTFRPQESEQEETTYYLKGLDPNATYEIVVADSQDTMTMSGQELMEQGLLCYYPEAAFSMLIYFNKK